MNNHKFGLALGSLMGLFHLFWGLLIAFGLAQGLLDFVYNLHSLNNPFIVMDFDLMRTLGLIVFTAFVGYVLGYVLAFFWNKFR